MRPYGAISEPSTADRGVEKWRSLKADFPVRIFQSPVSAPDSAAKEADSGGSTKESSVKSNRNSSLSRTSEDWFQASLFSTDPTSWDTSKDYSPPRRLRRHRRNAGTLSVTTSAYTGDFSRYTESPHCSMSSARWERWVTKARRDFSARQKQAQRINANAFSSSDTNPAQNSRWPTARAEDDASHKDGYQGDYRTDLGSSAANWPTPRTTDENAGRGAIPSGDTFYRPSKEFSAGEKVGQANLSDVSEMWPTPNTPSGGLNRQSTLTHTGGPDLDGAVLNWGTPTSRDWKDGTSADTVPQNGLLGRQAGNWPTPDASPDRGTTNRYTEGNTKTGRLLKQEALRWPTPIAKCAEDSQTHHGGARSNELLLTGAAQAFRCSPPAPEPPNSGSEFSESTPNLLPPSRKKRLNPYFVEFLQALPLNWTSKTARIDSEAWGTWLARSRRLVRSLCSAHGPE